MSNEQSSKTQTVSVWGVTPVEPPPLKQAQLESFLETAPCGTVLGWSNRVYKRLTSGRWLELNGITRRKGALLETEDPWETGFELPPVDLLAFIRRQTRALVYLLRLGQEASFYTSVENRTGKHCQRLECRACSSFESFLSSN